MYQRSGRDQTYTKDVGVNVCSAASMRVESVMGNCWRSGAKEPSFGTHQLCWSIQRKLTLNFGDRGFVVWSGTALLGLFIYLFI